MPVQSSKKLERGHTVVADRFIDSSLAYQGGARRLGIDAVEQLNLPATQGLVPDFTFYLKLDADAARARSGQDDRIEAEGKGFQAAVIDAYAELVERYPDRYVVLDATQPVESLREEVWKTVAERRTAHAHVR